jgi:6-pyruvoyltetrahydropterin/6-carboxytetrahydropterin synthase
MWKITKDFDFCYAHRVWTQNLEKELSCGASPKCRHLHGHNGIIKITLEGNKLDDRGYVLDFVELNFIKKFIDDVLDHKFLIDKKDPAYYYIIHHKNNNGYKEMYPLKDFPENYSIIDPNYFKTIYDENLVQILESFVIVNFVPTSENFSKWLFDIVDKKLKPMNIKVSSVQFFETPKSNSLYIG